MKRYIVRKYIMADSAAQAIRLDKKTPVDDVWVDDAWMAEHTKSNIGYNEDKKSRN